MSKEDQNLSDTDTIRDIWNSEPEFLSEERIESMWKELDAALPGPTLKYWNDEIDSNGKSTYTWSLAAWELNRECRPSVMIWDFNGNAGSEMSETAEGYYIAIYADVGIYVGPQETGKTLSEALDLARAMAEKYMRGDLDNADFKTDSNMIAFTDRTKVVFRAARKIILAAPEEDRVKGRLSRIERRVTK